MSNSPAQTARPNGQHNARALFTPHDAAHLQRLEAAIAVANERARRFHSLHEEEQMLMMRRPLTTEQAFRYFGLLLGLLPPAAILLKTLVVEAGDGPLSDSRLQTLVVTLLLGLAINSACALVGRIRGGKVARRIERAEYASWPRTLVVAFGSGAEWGVLTGACGGALFFFIGALFGVACALPVALVGFPLFTVCHRLLARGGMIDARHFWPVACGVAALLAALILSPGLIPY
ncbi:MAG TPA: hypothetical protein VF525_18830 [Pyrinomonadaceae bacterium]